MWESYPWTDFETASPLNHSTYSERVRGHRKRMNSRRLMSHFKKVDGKGREKDTRHYSLQQPQATEGSFNEN